jgi:hypothetical protein
LNISRSGAGPGLGVTIGSTVGISKVVDVNVIVSLTVGVFSVWEEFSISPVVSTSPVIGMDVQAAAIKAKTKQANKILLVFSLSSPFLLFPYHLPIVVNFTFTVTVFRSSNDAIPAKMIGRTLMRPLQRAMYVYSFWWLGE